MTLLGRLKVASRRMARASLLLCRMWVLRVLWRARQRVAGAELMNYSEDLDAFCESSAELVPGGLLLVTSDRPIAAGASFRIVRRLSRGQSFTCKHVAIEPVSAGSFTIDRIQIGNYNQIVTPGPIPGRAMMQARPLCEFDRLSPEYDLTIVVTNIGKRSEFFSCALIGDYA